MEKDLNNFPIIDWELGTKLAGNKPDIAAEMLDLMMQSLPDDVTAIQKLHSEKNYSDLAKRVHKLHGAICYVGLPRIKTILDQLERDLKSNIMDSLSQHLSRLDTEVSLLLQHYSRHQIV